MQINIQKQQRPKHNQHKNKEIKLHTEAGHINTQANTKAPTTATTNHWQNNRTKTEKDATTEQTSIIY
jgi:hypothetical protein